MAGQGKLFITGFAVVGLFLFGSWSLGGTRAAERKAQAGAPDAVKVDPKHYKVELENDRVRVVRITYGPREKSVMHGHRAGIGVFQPCRDRKSTRLNSSHGYISYAVFCLKKKKKTEAEI